MRQFVNKLDRSCPLGCFYGIFYHDFQSNSFTKMKISLSVVTKKLGDDLRAKT